MVLNQYTFGSFVYGTNTHLSDNDMIFITDEKIISDNINHHYYTKNEFQLLINQHDIAALECIFSHSIFKTESIQFIFNLDKWKLRQSISGVSSNSFVKAKKKLIVIADYDKYLGVKSFFHSLRIIDYGIQIAQHSKIINFKSMNWLFDDLQKLSCEYDGVELWEKIDTKYRKLYNKKHSTFKELCPKPSEFLTKKEMVISDYYLSSDNKIAIWDGNFFIFYDKKMNIELIDFVIFKPKLNITKSSK